MKNYSIFERSMHWITLVILVIKSSICTFNDYLNKAYISPGEEQIVILSLAFKNSLSSSLFLMVIIYWGLSFQKYASNKNASLLLTIVLLSYVLHDLSNLWGIYFTEAEGILFLLSIILFFPSVFNGKHMVIERQKNEEILDDI